MKNIKTFISAIGLAIVFQSNVCAQKKEVQYLSGRDNKSTVRWDFYCTGGRQSGYWTNIQVPSCWEQQGFGSYNYGRDYKTNGKNFRFFDEKGMYRYRFSVPGQWKDKEVFIVFEGSMTDTEVKVNGKSSGPIHQGSFYRFKYNITDKLIAGQNLLEVTVSKMSADASINNAERLADYWIFGGIFRPVYLEAVPHEYIDHVTIDAKADGSFKSHGIIKNLQSGRVIKAEITNAGSEVVASIDATLNKDDSVFNLDALVKNVMTWTSETPNIYTVSFSLMQGTRTIFKTSEKFGFRTIEIRRGDGIYLNGVQVKMKGINRHCFWPETGRTLNDEIQLTDVRLIKEMNMNAVRCSHYPPDKRFLELCDSLGLYVIDELAGWQKAYSTKAGEPLVKEMIIRDANHPSIIFWANGNEGGTNKDLDDDFLKWDFSKRPVIHPHHRPGNDFNGIDCNHYEDYYSTQKILADSLIYMPTEFLHSQDDGGGGSGLYDFWELHWKSKRSGGGFIWALLDEGIVRTDMNNVIDVNGLNANDGVLGPHREKEGSFFAIKEILSPVKINMKELPDSFGGKFEIENRFHFTNISQCKFRWALVNFKKPADPMTGYKVMKKGTTEAPNIPPNGKGFIQLNLPTDYKQFDALIFVAVDPHGQEVYRWTWKIKSNEQLLAEILAASDSIVSVTENDSTFILSASGITALINKKNGLLRQTRSLAGGNNLSFTNGPVLVQGMGSVTSYKSSKEGNDAVVSFVYSGDMKSARWKMFGSGWVSLEYEYEMNGSFPFAGVSFSYPENFILSAKWLGKGPYRQWKNRPQGTSVSVWQNFYNNTQTSYYPVVYPEFKGYYGEITWMEFSTVEGKFYVASKDNGLYVRLFDFYGLTGSKPHPGLPIGNISFLDCIPPIGTKLALNISPNTTVLGPQSEPTKILLPIKRTLYFYFGLPKNSRAGETYSRPEVDEVF